ncbi:MAG: HAMP domain-containing histidine kinase [Bacteroides sp.]|nr:HAMP domain-containing histidine kinase [Bacteroides sp.]
MERLKPIAENIQYWKVYFGSQKLLINTYIYNCQYEYAFNEASQMLEKAENVKDITGKVAAYQCMATIYHETDRWQEEKEILKKTYDLLPQIEYVGTKVNILNQLITFSKQRKSYADLKTYLDRTKQILDAMVRNNPIMQKNLADQYLFLEIYYTYLYLGTDNPNLAEEHYEKCKSYISPDTFLPYLVTHQNMAIEYCLYTKEYDTALALADSAISIVKENDFGISDYAKEAGYKADILKAMGRYDEALPLYERVTQIEDSISTSVSNKQLEEIEDSYHLNQLLLEQGKLKSYIQIIILGVVGIVLILCITHMFRMNRIRKELQLSEKETKEAALKTEEVNEVKSRFLSNMSHAIRVPLNSMVGFSQLMASDTELNEETRKEYSKIIQKNTEELMLLVNNVLDLSRLEADMMKYQLTDYDVVQLCNDAVSAVRMQKPNLHIQFRNSVEQHIVYTDCNRIIQLIISIFAGPSTLDANERDVLFTLDRNGEILCLKVVNSPLADSRYAGQETAIRHDINRLLLKHFGGTYQIIADAPEGPTILFTYPAAPVQ